MFAQAIEIKTIISINHLTQVFQRLIVGSHSTETKWSLKARYLAHDEALLDQKIQIHYRAGSNSFNRYRLR